MTREEIYNLKIQHSEKLAAYREKLYAHPQLRQLFFELTLKCNEACFHCGSSCGAARPDGLPAEKYIEILDEVKRNFDISRLMLCITGGEPLLREDFFDILGYASGIGYTWGMTSNATLITPVVARRLYEAGMATISVSIDGLEKTHDRLRGLPGGYRLAMEGIENLLAEREAREAEPRGTEGRGAEAREAEPRGAEGRGSERCGSAGRGAESCESAGCESESNRAETGKRPFRAIQVTTVINHENIRELDDLYRIFEDMDIDSWRVIGLEPIGRALLRPELMLTPDDQRRLLSFIYEKRCEQMPVTYGCSHFVGFDYEREVRDWYFLCNAGIYTAGIMANGDVGACLDIERNPRTIQGNILATPFTKIWNERFEIFRQPLSGMCEGCRDCAYERYCAGGAHHSYDYEKDQQRICMKGILFE